MSFACQLEIDRKTLTPMYRFHLSIHARPTGTLSSQPWQLDDESYAALQLANSQQSLPIPVSFEEAVERLNVLPRMFVEPDGSFVWVGQQDNQDWQLDGCLYDRGPHVMYVDVAGCCPSTQFDQLLTTLGWPETQLVFQLSQYAVFLGEEELRRCALRKGAELL